MTTLLRIIGIFSILTVSSGCFWSSGHIPYRSQSHYSVLAAGGQSLDLSVRWFHSMPGLGGISDFAWADPSTQRELIIAGTKAVAWVDMDDINNSRRVRLNPSPKSGGDIEILDIDSDGEPEFLVLGQHWRPSVSVYETNGSLLWKYPSAVEQPTKHQEPALEFTLPLDTNDDGLIEFLIGFNASDEVVLLDHLGEEIWRQDWGVISAYPIAFDFNRDGTREIVYLANDRLVVRDMQGRIVDEIIPPIDGIYTNYLGVIRSDNGGEELCLGGYQRTIDKQFYFRVSSDGSCTDMNINYQSLVGFLKGDSVRLASDENSYFVSSNERLFQGRMMVGYERSDFVVTISDRNNNMVYQESFAPSEHEKTSSARGACIVKRGSGDEQDVILVGYGDRVWVVDDDNDNHP